MVAVYIMLVVMGMVAMALAAVVVVARDGGDTSGKVYLDFW